MKKTVFFLLVALTAISFSCKQKTADQPVAQDDDTYLMNHQDTMNVINAIIDTSDCQQYSLDYSRYNNKAHYSATLFCDGTGKIRRIEENIIDSNTLMTRNTFYFTNDRLFATTHEYQQKEDTSLAFFEELNFYSPKGKVEKQFHRKTDETTDPNNNPFLVTTNNKIVNTDQVNNAIQNKGDFELTFQGIIKTDNSDYLLLGKNVSDGYTTALQIPQITPFIQDIYRHENEYIGRKIKIEFAKQSEGNFTYQVFVSGEWL